MTHTLADSLSTLEHNLSTILAVFVIQKTVFVPKNLKNKFQQKNTSKLFHLVILFELFSYTISWVFANFMFDIGV
jgi:hypothetical protein